MPNRLTKESSPYLLQHADNPVDWYPWGAEAFRAAKEQDKPILLSIGYAACHWCHVMAHESFEDEATAALMNQLYINIKVDREERPDVDQIYMNAVVAMRQHGGWPLTVVLTSDGKPFFGGTYFPKVAMSPQMPSFQQVLVNVADAWKRQRDEILESAEGLIDHLNSNFKLMGGDNTLDKATLDKALGMMGGQFDKANGGFGDAPKFPQPMNLEFLVRAALGTGDENVTHMLTHTLEKMAYGGMYDQIGGGFARYSTDAQWLVPHFEKMLYDNAQLARVYLHAWQMTGRPLFKRIAEETLEYMRREMRDDSGGFYSSQDADSEGEEGKFYVWQMDELQQILGDDLFPFSVYYGVTAHGNWEGKNILHMPQSHQEAAEKLQMDPDELHELIGNANQKVYEARSERVWPGLDDKVLTSWNGLALAAFAEAGRILGRDDYTQIAVENAEFLYEIMRGTNGRLMRTWKDGSEAKYNGYLEDYAFLADGLVALYQTTFDDRRLTWAIELADLMLAHFADDENGGFYDTSDDHEELIYRPKDVQDNAQPSGNSAAALALLHLGQYTGKAEYTQTAYKSVAAMYGAMMQYPNGFGHWLNAAAQIVNEAHEIAIIGRKDADDTQALLDRVRADYRPYDVVALGAPDETTAVPLLTQRPQVDGKATAYVCQNFACRMPTTDPDELAKQLAG